MMSRMRTLASKLQKEPSIGSFFFRTKLILSLGFIILEFSFFIFNISTTFILSSVKKGQVG